MNNTDIIIFSGQSNMQGQSEALPKENLPVDGAMEYLYDTDLLILLKHPVGENLDDDGNTVFEKDGDFWKEWDKSQESVEWLLGTNALLSSTEGNANLVPFFCDSYVKKTGRKCVAVHTAKGSTTISYWLKGARGYEIMLKKAKAAIEKVNPDNIYFVWLQGESDALESRSFGDYKKDIEDLNDSLKKDLGIDKFGIILVGRFTNDERDFEIIEAQRQVCKDNSDFIMLTELSQTLLNDKENVNPHANGHFSLKGFERLGKDAGENLGVYVKGCMKI